MATHVLANLGWLYVYQAIKCFVSWPSARKEKSMYAIGKDKSGSNEAVCFRLLLSRPEYQTKVYCVTPLVLLDEQDLVLESMTPKYD